MSSRWYAVQVHTGCELRAAAAIAEADITAIAPMLRQRRKPSVSMTWRQKQALRTHPTIDVALFPGYILVSFDRDRDQWSPIMRMKHAGVIKLVPAVPEGDRPAPIPLLQAEWLMKRIGPDGFWVDVEEAHPWSHLKKDQIVRVAEGPFTSFPAKIEEMPDRERIKVLVNIFGRNTVVELDYDQVEAVR